MIFLAGPFLWLWLGVPTTTAPPCPANTRVNRLVALNYPRFAAMAGIEGEVELVATVAADGSVKSVDVTRGIEPLARPAVETLTRWTFTRCVNTQSECRLTVTFSFRLTGDCRDSFCPTDFEADLPHIVTITSKRARIIVD